jgi:hypothetical protein
MQFSLLAAMSFQEREIFREIVELGAIASCRLAAPFVDQTDEIDCRG